MPARPRADTDRIRKPARRCFPSNGPRPVPGPASRDVSGSSPVARVGRAAHATRRSSAQTDLRANRQVAPGSTASAIAPAPYRGASSGPAAAPWRYASDAYQGAAGIWRPASVMVRAGWACVAATGRSESPPGPPNGWPNGKSVRPAAGHALRARQF